MSYLMKHGNGLGTCVPLVAGNADLLDVAAGFVRRYEDLALAGATEGGEGVVRKVLGLQPQVIVIDLDAPGRSGLEAIPRLRTALPEVGTIALTLSDGSADRQAALAAGADELVCKADLITDLVPAIHRVIDRLQKKRTGGCRRHGCAWVCMAVHGSPHPAGRC